jgi:hypothetical protein
MKKVRLLIAILGGAIAGVIAGLILPAEWRGKLSRPLEALIRGMVEHMPDG